MSIKYLYFLYLIIKDIPKRSKHPHGTPCRKIAKKYPAHIILLNCDPVFLSNEPPCAAEMEALMERNTREPSRERINDSYLRQMLREEARYSQRERETGGCGRDGCQKRTSCPYTPTFNGSIGEGCSKGRPLAMVYAEKQDFRELYEAKEALKRGTLFKELDFPLGV